MKTNDVLLQTGQGVNGERLSSVRSSPTDFPDQPQGRTDLGSPDGYPRREREETTAETIPERVSANQIQQDAIARAKRGGLA